MSLDPMIGAECFLLYGSSSPEDCVELCSVIDVNWDLNRPEVDMTPWASGGFKRAAVGDLSGKVDVVGCYKRGNAEDETDFDDLLARMISFGAAGDADFDFSARGQIQHVFILDKWLCGLYYAAMSITNLGHGQPFNGLVTYRFTLVPNDIPYWYKNGSFS